MGLQNRKKLQALCKRYGLVGIEDRDGKEIVIIRKGERFPLEQGLVSFSELREPDWESLESLVLKLSVSTGAFLE